MSISIQTGGVSIRPPSPSDEAGPVRAAAPTTATSSATAHGAAPSEDAAISAPKPLRFPWLSRLSQELESAARSKPAFPQTPITGENVDRKV